MRLTKSQKAKILGPLLATPENLKEFDAYIENLEEKIKRKKNYAKHLRNVMSHQEIEMWEHLTSSVFTKQNIRFKRQVAKFGYVLDFYCTSAALAIELDGGYHDHPEQEIKDRMRDFNFAKIGISTFRVKTESLKNIRPVLLQIRQEINDRHEMFRQWHIKKPNLFMERKALKFGFLRYMDTQRIWTGFDDSLIF